MKIPSALPTFPLSFANSGETVILADVCACDKLRKHLGELGLNVGMRVRVIQSSGSGPLIVAAAHDSRLALGRSMAQKIMVRRLEG
jgi:Fe2+ transport system protein FeoA